MLFVIYLAIGLILSYGFESDEGSILDTSPLITLVIVVAWPFVLWTIFRDSIGLIKKWRGKRIWNLTK